VPPRIKKHPGLYQKYLHHEELVAMKNRHVTRLAAIEDGRSNMDADLERAILNETFAVMGKEGFLVWMPMEKYIVLFKKEMIDMARDVGPVFDWLISIKGIGANLAAKLLALIDDISTFTTVSKLWRRSGFGIFEYWFDASGKIVAPKTGLQWCKKEKKPVEVVADPKPGWTLRKHRDVLVPKWMSPYDNRLKTTGYLIAYEQFVIQRTPLYSDFYYQAKDEYREKHPEPVNGKYTKGHIDYMAKRKTCKLFLRHLWFVWRTLEGMPTNLPYAHAHLGHVDLIPPPNWPMA